MSVHQVLKAASEAGLTLMADGPNLVVEYEGEPPEALLAELRRHKPELLSILAGKPPSVVDLAAERHRRRIAANEACLAGIGLGPDGRTPVDEYRRLEKQGQEVWEGKPTR